MAIAFRTTVFAICTLFCLNACHSESEAPKRTPPATPKDQVYLSPDSPKRGFIKEALVEPTRRTLLDPLSGAVAYDESRSSRIFSPVAGRVTGEIAALGTHVQAGATLLVLDSPELGQAQADYAKAQADLGLAERAFRRSKELFEGGVAPRKEFEQAQDDLARARSEAERTQLKLANLGVHDGRTDDRFVLKAPISGVVTERNVNPGMEVRSDRSDPLFVISDLDRVWVLMDVFEKDIGLIHVGQQVAVHVQAFPDQRFVGTVDYLSQVVDDASRTVKVRCVLANPDHKLLPAMYASVEVLSDPKDTAIVVPLDALFTEGESDWLFVAVGDGHYQKRPVKVGQRLKDRAVISEGLSAGERLVVDGALLLRTEEDAEQDAGPAR
ncbi:MAG: efflux RND transporter periplasmic adaptor subunit [Methylococcaceae bacterium]|nr:efflux RND transporter periplasmic adaptor subunit [Methylococcaceae bacterium]